MTIDLSAEGSYPGMPSRRSFTFDIVGQTSAPSAVTFNGKSLSGKDWKYNTADGVLSVTVKWDGTPATLRITK